MATKTTSWVGLVLERGPYRVTSLVGEGGMGHVYRAQNLHKGGDVVLKVPRQALIEEDPEFGQRFLREVRSLVRLEHRHIVPILDVGEYRGLPYAVLPYLAGGALRDRQPTAQGKPVPMDPATLHAWLPQIAGALDFIHSRDYIHRDIKPENILFDARGMPFLADFGIAKALQTGGQREQTVKTQAGVVLGTPQYMAPELILGRPYDGRVDQYALAIMIYELLSGTYPFDDPAVTAIFLLHTTKKATPLESLVPSLPYSLVDAVARGMAKNPKQRFVTCSELADAVLEEVPPPAAPRAAKEKPPPLPAQAPKPRHGASGRFVEEVQAVLPCPHCRREFGMPPGLAGSWVSCPACQKSFKVPEGASSGPHRAPAETRGNDPVTLTDAPRKALPSVEAAPAPESSNTLLIVLFAVGGVLALGFVLSLCLCLGLASLGSP